MRYGNSMYYTTAKQDQVEAFDDEVYDAIQAETKRTMALNAKLAKAGMLIRDGRVIKLGRA